MLPKIPLITRVRRRYLEAGEGGGGRGAFVARLPLGVSPWNSKSQKRWQRSFIIYERYYYLFAEIFDTLIASLNPILYGIYFAKMSSDSPR